MSDDQKKYNLLRFRPHQKWTLVKREGVGEEAENTQKMTYEEALKERDRRNKEIKNPFQSLNGGGLGGTLDL